VAALAPLRAAAERTTDADGGAPARVRRRRRVRGTVPRPAALQPPATVVGRLPRLVACGLPGPPPTGPDRRGGQPWHL